VASSGERLGWAAGRAVPRPSVSLEGRLVTVEWSKTPVADRTLRFLINASLSCFGRLDRLKVGPEARLIGYVRSQELTID